MQSATSRVSESPPHPSLGQPHPLGTRLPRARLDLLEQCPRARLPEPWSRRLTMSGRSPGGCVAPEHGPRQPLPWRWRRKSSYDVISRWKCSRPAAPCGSRFSIPQIQVLFPALHPSSGATLPPTLPPSIPPSHHRAVTLCNKVCIPSTVCLLFSSCSPHFSLFDSSKRKQKSQKEQRT